MPHKMVKPSSEMMTALENDDFDCIVAREGMVVGVRDDDGEGSPFVLMLVGTCIPGDRRSAVMFGSMAEVEDYAAALIQAGREVFGPQPKRKIDG